ncbi:2-methylisocitrate lyase [Podospora conica]|nr:2-methylisocitrate lyase [Schizothecium conicum]
MASPPNPSTGARATAFKALHRPSHPLLLANIYDAASANIVAALPGTVALATASYAVAAALGTTDEQLPLDAYLAALRPIADVARRFNKPLSVDLQSGYGTRLEEAVRAVVRAPIGAAGVNIEDSDQKTGAMMAEDEAVARIKRVLAVAREERVGDLVVNARADSFIRGGTLEESVARGKRYLEAGATTVYIFWPEERREMDEEGVKFAVRELGGMVNLAPGKLRGGKGLTSADLKRLGVARVSVGPSLWFAAKRALEEMAEEVYKVE